MKLFFTTDFRNVLKYKISWKFVRWEPSYSMRSEGQTDVTKIIVPFRNFAKAPKMVVTDIFNTLGLEIRQNFT